jgi:hypothetical protein
VSDKTACDICGNSPAQRVEVGVVLYGVVIPEMPTGFSEAIDACAADQVAAIDALFAHSKATLEEQVPFHREMQEHAATRDAAQRDLDGMRPMLAMLAEVPSDKWTEDAKRTKAEADAIAARVAEGEVARVAAFTKAREKHDARTAAFLKGLKKKA